MFLIFGRQASFQERQCHSGLETHLRCSWLLFLGRGTRGIRYDCRATHGQEIASPSALLLSCAACISMAPRAGAVLSLLCALSALPLLRAAAVPAVAIPAGAGP